MVDASGFLVDDDVVAARMAEVMSKIKLLCQIDRHGHIFFLKEARGLGAKERIRLALAARFVGARIDQVIKAEMTLAELSTETGIPRDQVSARAAELTREGFALSTARGVFRAVGARIEQFLDEVVGVTA